MPKRTNEFQQAVQRIYEQLVPEGAVVTESALVKERASDVQREVDILIEYRLADVVMRLGIECRDRSRASDIEWIDQLIGKYHDLPVDHVIAVSRSGFSTAAAAKAQAHRIEVRSLTDALDTEWPGELTRLGLGCVTMNVCLVGYRMDTEPAWGSTPPAAISSGTTAPLPLAGFFEKLLPKVRAFVAGKVFKEVVLKAKTKAEITGSHERTVVLTASNLTVVGADGSRAALLRLTFSTETKVTLEDVGVQRQLYGPVGVTSGVIEAPEFGCSFRITAIQAPGKEVVKPLVTRLPLERGDE